MKSFLIQSNEAAININESSVYDYFAKENPVCYHVFNVKRNKHYQNALPFFYKIYNVSAIQMHKMDAALEVATLTCFHLT